MAFTSSAAPSILTRRSSSPAGAAGSNININRGNEGDWSGGDGGSDGNDQPLPGSKGGHISIVDVDPTPSARRDRGCRWVSTGERVVPRECGGYLQFHSLVISERRVERLESGQRNREYLVNIIAILVFCVPPREI